MPPASLERVPEYRFSPAPLVPRYVTSLLNRVADAGWEWRLGIRTTGGATPREDDEAKRYGYLAYYTYFAILDALDLQPDDVLADLGCGKGRIICAAARYAVKEVVGVEIDPPLCAEAKANARRLRGRRAPIRCECGSATEFDYDSVTAIVMFHPFGPATLEAVLERWHDSLSRRPRPLRIAYGNPVLTAQFAAKPWLELYDAWNPGPWSRIKFPVHFYRTVAERSELSAVPSRCAFGLSALSPKL